MSHLTEHDQFCPDTLIDHQYAVTSIDWGYGQNNATILNGLDEEERAELA